jgi:RNA polymerase sigma-70 factor (ECF subfamily)
VLRFLKWKTRLLALDVIRASGKAYINSLDDIQEPESLDPEVSSHLESQDDAAVVKLALSKLNPRHREVLIASMYEEKSTEQIASQVGLSENATRQLIFRARAAFKKALIGDIDTTGMSAGAILSVAARKAAQESKKIGASAMALIALVVMSLVAFPSLTGNRQADNLAGGTIESPPSQSQQDPSGTADQSGQGTATDTDASNDAAGAAADAAMDADGLAADANQAAARVAAPAPARSPSATPTPTEDPFSNQSLRSIFDSKTSTSLFALDEKLVVFADNGVSASFIFNPTAEEPFKDVFAEFEIGEAIFAAYPNSSEWLSATDPQGQERFVYFGALNYVYDEKGKIWSKSDLAKATLRIEVILEKGSLKVKQVLLNVLSKG